MRKILTIFLSIISLTLMAQVPQGVGYQGVATDANGIELVNQSISIRASVLSGSSTGTIEWEETHATSTDTFGLFSLTIGQGTNTTNGAQTSFADISWGTNTHFLKIEMDVTGGSTYSFMGTNQMMSVPYALYAENANINYDSISNLLSNDSTFITNVGGGMGGGGCNWIYPDGFDGQSLIWELPNNDYTVPNGKNLYITVYDAGPNGNWLFINGTNFGSSLGYKKTIVVGAGSVVSTSSVTSANPANFVGFLADANVTPITYELPNNNYTVPNGKKLYITAFQGAGNGEELLINGISLDNLPSLAIREMIVADAGSVLSTPSVTSASPANFNGYLVDENYFAGCGGGGSSSSTASSSGGGFGYSLMYPEGFDGDPITYDMSTGDYTVPSGKNLYITNLFQSQSNDLFINGVKIRESGINNAWNARGNNLILAQEGDILSSLGGGGANIATFNGFLTESTIDIITHDLSVSYTVPNGKKLFVTNMMTAAGPAEVFIDNIKISEDLIFSAGGTGLSDPFILDEGQVISSNITSINSMTFNGYLVDENYFAGCGGGGGSSNNGTGNMVVSTFGDTLTLNGQSIIVPGISYPNTPSSLFSTVTDIDGNTYQTVSIYGTEWMMEDLKTTTYSNGDPIIQSSDITQPSYNFDANDPQYIYYNTLAIRDSRNVCPTSWHVPTISEWEGMILLFGDKVPTGNMFGFRYENAAPALKSFNDGLNGNWGTNTVTNISHLSIKELGRMFPNNNNASMGNYSYSITSTIVPSVPDHNWNVSMEDTGSDVDNVHIDSDDYYFNTRCVKD